MAAIGSVCKSIAGMARSYGLFELQLHDFDPSA